MVFLRGTIYTHVHKLLCGTTHDVTDYSQAWTVDMESASTGYDLDVNAEVTERDDSDSGSDTESDSDSEAEIDSDDDDVVADAPIKSPPNGQLVSEAYTEFLQFLELGCSGSPVEGYPLVLVILAGIPQSVWFTLRALSTA